MFFKANDAKNNKLQSHYGHPAVHKENDAHNLIHGEFASIWNNIFSFNTAIVKILPSNSLLKTPHVKQDQNRLCFF